MSKEEESEILFTRFQKIFDGVKLNEINEHTPQDVVKRKSQAFKMAVSSILIKEFSTEKASNEESYDATFSLFSDEEKEEFDKKLNDAVAKFVVEIKEGKGDKVFAEETKSTTLLRRFILGLVTLGVYELCYMVTHNRRAHTKFKNLLIFCQKKNEKIRKEYHDAVGSFPRPEREGLFDRIFGGKSKEQFFEEKLASHKEYVAAQIAEDVAVRKIQAAFRVGKAQAKGRKEILAKIDKKESSLERQGKDIQKRKLRLAAEATATKQEVEARRAEQGQHMNKEARLDAQLEILGGLWEKRKNTEKNARVAIKELEEEIVALQKQMTSEVPRTWGIFNRGAVEAKEKGRVMGLQSQIKEKEARKVVLFKEAEDALEKADHIEETMLSKRSKVGSSFEEEGEMLAKRETEALGKYSRVKQSQNKAERADIALEQKKAGLSGYKKTIQEREERAARGKQSYVERLAASRSDSSRKHTK